MVQPLKVSKQGDETHVANTVLRFEALLPFHLRPQHQQQARSSR